MARTGLLLRQRENYISIGRRSVLRLVPAGTQVQAVAASHAKRDVFAAAHFVNRRNPVRANRSFIFPKHLAGLLSVSADLVIGGGGCEDQTTRGHNRSAARIARAGAGMS